MNEIQLHSNSTYIHKILRKSHFHKNTFQNKSLQHTHTFINNVCICNNIKLHDCWVKMNDIHSCLIQCPSDVVDEVGSFIFAQKQNTTNCCEWIFINTSVIHTYSKFNVLNFYTTPDIRVKELNMLFLP